VRLRKLGTPLAVALLGCGRIGFPNAGDAVTSDVGAADAPISVVLASDDFARTLSGTWGTADVGGSWLIYNPDAATVGVAGDHAFATMNTATTYADFQVPSATAIDSEVSAIVSFGSVPATGSQYAFIMLRWVATSTAYLFVAELDAAGTMQAVIRRNTPAGPVTISTATNVLTNVAANDRIALALRATRTSPTTLCARMWRDGTAEPSACTTTVQDATPALQARGISYLGAQNVGSATPATLSFATFRFLRVGPL
jgi:hypothetical protein